MTQRVRETLIPNLLRLSQLAGIIGLIFVVGKREHLIETLEKSDERQDVQIQSLLKATQDLVTSVSLHEYQLRNLRTTTDRQALKNPDPFVTREPKG